MATPGKPLSDQEQERLRRLRQHGLSIRELAREEQVSTRTVQKYIKSRPSTAS